MKAIVIAKQGTPVSPNVQVVGDWPDPTAGPGEVLVKTKASALNHLDLWIGRGLPGLDFAYPRITGSDGCGTIEAVGAGVDESWIGKRIALNAAVPQPNAPLRFGQKQQPFPHRIHGRRADSSLVSLRWSASLGPPGHSPG